MDTSAARKILCEQLARFGNYTAIVPLVKLRHVETLEVRGEGNIVYQVEVQFLWDDKPGDTIRVVGSIDDGGLRAFFPVTESLLLPPPVDI
jgi:hypothetical protein